MGTLADELESADEDDDDYDWDQEEETTTHQREEALEGDSKHRTTMSATPTLDPLQTEDARDSGIDGGFERRGQHQKISSHGPSHKIFRAAEEVFSMELEHAMQDISNLAQASTQSQIDTTKRTISALRDLSSQVELETSSHRFATSMNSITAYLTTHIKTLHSSASMLFSPLFSLPHEDEASYLLTLHTALQQALPAPDPTPLQHLVRLERDTADLQLALSGLLDSLQLARQLSAAAARALKLTCAMVSDLRREAERSDEATFYIDHGDWDSKLARRWCADQCRDVVRGFEGVCDGLRAEIEAAAG